MCMTSQNNQATIKVAQYLRPETWNVGALTRIGCYRHLKSIKKSPAMPEPMLKQNPNLDFKSRIVAQFNSNQGYLRNIGYAILEKILSNLDGKV